MNNYTPNLKDELYEAQRALKHIPADIPRKDWVRVATAFKSAGGTLEYFMEWSSRAGSFDEKDCRNMWRSISVDAGVSVGTLFYIAKDCGYERDAKFKPDKQALMKLEAERKNREFLAKIERKKQNVDASRIAQQTIDGCSTTTDHRYLTKKRVVPVTPFLVDSHNNIVLPVQDIWGKLHSTQSIGSYGFKKFAKGGAIKGHFYKLHHGSNKRVVICEGLATGITLQTHYEQDSTIIVAFSAGNLLPVANELVKVMTDYEIVICGDNDRSGVGQQQAIKAATAVGGVCKIPKFKEGEIGSDFNDRWCLDNPENRS